MKSTIQNHSPMWAMTQMMSGLNQITLATKSMKCEIYNMSDDERTLVSEEAGRRTICIQYPELTRDSRGNHLLAGDRYIVVTCYNGCRYYINITADSPMTAAYEVLNFLQYK